MKKNKYEDIIILDLDEKTDIVDLYMDELDESEETVGIVTDRFTMDYLLQEVLDSEYTSINYIDLAPERLEDPFVMHVTAEGYITVAPLDYIKQLKVLDVVFIDMDGDVGQEVIDFCVDNDKDVRLFGLTDEPVQNCKKCKSTYHICKDKNVQCPRIHDSRLCDGYESSYYYSGLELDEEDIRRILRAFLF